VTPAAQGVATRTVIWGLVGVAGIISAFQVGIGTPLQPGAGMFPFIVCLAIVAIAVLDAGVMLRTQDLGHGEEAANAQQGRKRVLVMAAVLAYAALLPLVGSVLTMMGITFVLMFVIERLPAKLCATVSVTTGLGLFLIFEVLLDVPLPAGWVWTSLGVM
jgi:putative tricarboxylic transport membrane protein